MRLPDQTLSLRTEGYAFLPRRFAAAGRDVVELRLLFQQAIAVRGHAAARRFYEDPRLVRDGAMPGPILGTLLGDSGVQTLDGAAHTHRRAMIREAVSPRREQAHVEAAGREWSRAAERWEQAGTVVLLDEASRVLFRAVSDWAGMPAPEAAIDRRTDEMRAMVESAGSVGWRHIEGRLARGRAERRAARLVRAVREGRIRPAPGTALAIISHHRDLQGRLLDEHTAAVELLTLIRTTTAIARYVVFTALALVSFPEARRALQDGEIEPRWFVDEVRRFYPFFPAAAARTSQAIEWDGVAVPEGARVLLDLYGTNHDERLWRDPERFDPSRFASQPPGRDALIPQGGGDPETSHRCAGEPLTIALMEDALRFLTTEIEYDVPAQDLRVPLNRMPTGPNSGFVLANVRRRRGA